MYFIPPELSVDIVCTRLLHDTSRRTSNKKFCS